MTGGEVLEPVEPPIEKPEKPTTPPSTEDLRTININDEIMAVVGTNEWRSIAYGNGIYVAVGENGYVTTSTYGVNWTTPKVTTTVDGARTWHAIAYGNGKFVAISGYWVTSSTDGKTWITGQDISSAERATLGDITYGNGKFVIAMSNGYITYSTDGNTWATISRKFGRIYPNLTNICFGNGNFAGIWNKYAVSSADGETWEITESAELGAKIISWRAITYGKGKYVAVGYDGMQGYITSSVDGIAWTTPVQQYNVNWYNIAFCNGMFIACGSNGYITTSTDGETWTPKQLLKDENGNNVTKFLRGIIAVPAK